MTWKQSIRNRNFIFLLLFAILGLTVLSIVLNPFFQYINNRTGIVLNDPILNLLTPKDLSAYLFPIINLSILLVILNVYKKPISFLRFALTIVLVYTTRIVAMYLVPLDPPEGCIVLFDPFISASVYGGEAIVKDLFFSGHTAIMLTLLLVAENKYLKYALMFFLPVVMLMLLIQHAHYTIDLIAALIFVPLCWYVANKMIKIVLVD